MRVEHLFVRRSELAPRASPESDALKVLYRGWVETTAANPDMSIDEMRDMYEHWGYVTGEPGGIDYLETDVGGMPAFWAVPKGCREDRVGLCTHGGGYTVGSMYSHRKLFGHIAKAVGCRTLNLDYRRAPEHPHPAPVDDALRAYEWFLEQGCSPAHVFTAGDSAGGGLCTTVLLAIRDKGLHPCRPRRCRYHRGTTWKHSAARSRPTPMLTCWCAGQT